MAQKEKQLTAAEIAARRPQAAKTMKRKDGSTYSLGVSYGGAPKTSPKPKTRPAPAKTTKSTKSPSGKAVDDKITVTKLPRVVTEAEKASNAYKAKQVAKNNAGKTSNWGIMSRAGYAKGGMVKGKKC
jgi:hypothetical protein